MNQSMDGAPADAEGQPSLVSEVFHTLSQPLTVLQCSLDLALQRDTTIAELRASVQLALENAERLRQRLLLVRTLNDALHPGDLSQPTDLSALCGELQDHLRPLFESEGKKLELKSGEGSLMVHGDAAKLNRALFCFLEYLFAYTPVGASVVVGYVRGKGDQAEIEIEAAGCLPVSFVDPASPPYSCEIEMARRSFRAAGGGFFFFARTSHHSLWRATLPLF
jgi:signal transduction histidine kinase